MTNNSMKHEILNEPEELNTISNTEDKRFSLREITDLLYSEKNAPLNVEAKELDNENGKDYKQNFYNNKYKQLIELFKVLDLYEEFQQLKNANNIYSFSEKGKNFILTLLREYDGKCDPIRRAEPSKAELKFLLNVYSNTIDLFIEKGFDKNKITDIKIKLWNSLNLPQRLSDNSFEVTLEEVNNMVKNNMKTVSIGMNIKEKLYWQTAFCYAIHDLAAKWCQIYDIMADMRSSELCDYSNYLDDLDRINEIENFEFIYATEINDAIENDDELLSLFKEREALLGRGKKKPPHLKKIEKDYNETLQKINKRIHEIKRQVICCHIHEFEYPENWDIISENYEKSIPVEFLLKNAIDEKKSSPSGFSMYEPDDLIKIFMTYFP